MGHKNRGQTTPRRLRDWPFKGRAAMRAINAIRMGGVDVLPLVEGGKGVSISNGLSAGNWALAGGVGTFSAVNADSFDVAGRPIPQGYHGRTRRGGHGGAGGEA